MLSIPMIMGVIVLTAVVVVSGDDTQALRNTISSLCLSNHAWWSFCSCCGSYNNGASITLEDNSTWKCFISNLTSTADFALTSLFVICFIFDLFLLFDVCHCFFSSFFRSFEHKYITVLERGVFSSLKNLQSLFFHPLVSSFSLLLWNLYKTSVRSIESDAFNGLENLRELYLFLHRLVFNITSFLVH